TRTRFRRSRGVRGDDGGGSPQWQSPGSESRQVRADLVSARGTADRWFQPPHQHVLSPRLEPQVVMYLRGVRRSTLVSTVLVIALDVVLLALALNMYFGAGT